MEDCFECGGQANLWCKCGECVCSRCFGEHVRRDAEREQEKAERLGERIRFR